MSKMNYRKEALSPEIAATAEINLATPPTYLRYKLTINLDDYGKKESLVLRLSGRQRSGANLPTHLQPLVRRIHEKAGWILSPGPWIFTHLPLFYLTQLLFLASFSRLRRASSCFLFFLTEGFSYDLRNFNSFRMPSFTICCFKRLMAFSISPCRTSISIYGPPSFSEKTKRPLHGQGVAKGLSILTKKECWIRLA